MRRLFSLLTGTGFDSGQADALDDLRKSVRRGEKRLLGHKELDEALGLLTAIGIRPESHATPKPMELLRLAALKLLRHIFLSGSWGGRSVWVVSVLTVFRTWPSQDLLQRGGTRLMLEDLLRNKTEMLPEDVRGRFASAAQHALAWTQKALIVLTALMAARQSQGRIRADRELIIFARWFVDSTSSEKDVLAILDHLIRGFKRLQASLSGKKLVLTNWVPIRCAQSQTEEHSWLQSEAFTFINCPEGMDVVYIESAFFRDGENVLSGKKNWTRILVHELAHVAGGAVDVGSAQSRRYAWYGIGPHPGFPGTLAATNADSWAFFAADCAGQLTDGERARALRVV